ncbi:MAG TPA: ATP-binding cassette domain-containing protein [Polyangia bacterium]|nr:ATP-binding cassette domain-containing protein [Polyangia bacterium]
MNDEAGAVLRLDAVSKRFGDAVALAETSLDVPSAHTTVLLGPSGCGKTTALRLMLGLVRPDSGRVLFRGRPLGQLGDEELRQARTKMGYVVQEGGLFPHLTALDNVRLMARQLGWAAPRLAARVAELAELVRLPPDALARFPHELSGGQKQRVALMRALMLDPELLFLDEPLGALDPLVRADLQDDLAAIFRRLGKSVVLVTHDLAEAALFGHVLVLMQAGRVVQRGALDDLVARPASPFVTRFIAAQRRFDPEADAEAKA